MNDADPKWQAFLEWSRSSRGWSQQRISDEIATSRPHLNQVLTGKRTGGTTWRRVVKALPMEGVFLLQQCASWNNFAEAALQKRLAEEAEVAKLAELGRKCRIAMPAGVAVLLLLLGLSPSPARADEWSAQLAATAKVETPHGVKRGKAGELTKYQILPATWMRFSVVPMAKAPAAEVERVARCILREIGEQLDAQHLPRTPYEFALRWNAGAHAKYFTVETWHYARRVEDLVEGAR